MPRHDHFPCGHPGWIPKHAIGASSRDVHRENGRALALIMDCPGLYPCIYPSPSSCARSQNSPLHHQRHLDKYHRATREKPYTNRKKINSPATNAFTLLRRTPAPPLVSGLSLCEHPKSQTMTFSKTSRTALKFCRRTRLALGTFF